MKKYIKPAIFDEELEIEDVIASSGEPTLKLNSTYDPDKPVSGDTLEDFPIH